MDWNGTLTRSLYEKEFFNALLFDVLRHQPQPLRFALSLLRLKLRVSKRIPRPNRLSVHAQQDALNHVLRRRVSKEQLAEFLERRAAGESAWAECDREFLFGLRRLRASHDLCLGLISSGCLQNIELALSVAELQVDFLHANSLSVTESGRLRFELDIFENKASLLQEELQKRDIPPRDVAYISDDEHDLDCLRLVGVPIVAPLAQPDARENLKERVNAFCPSTHLELLQFLEERI